MAGVKIQKFYGVAPKIASELLPATVGQVASNVKLYSGNLLPVNNSSLVQSLYLGAATKTVYPMINGATLKWLSWGTDVDVAQVPLVSNASQRIV